MEANQPTADHLAERFKVHKLDKTQYLSFCEEILMKGGTIGPLMSLLLIGLARET